MKTVNIYEAKKIFSRLIHEALKGEEIVIAKSGHPLIRLVPYAEELPKRVGGQLKGILKISDDFDDPLPESVLKSFYGEDAA